MPNNTPPDANQLPSHARFAAKALAIAAKKPGAMVLAQCTNKQTGATVTTYCLLIEDQLYPFALIPDFDLREQLIAPTHCLSVNTEEPAAAPPARRMGFDTRSN